MFATHGGIIQRQQELWDYTGENPNISSIHQQKNSTDFPFVLPPREYNWAEEVYQPDILNKKDFLYKEPGYNPFE